MGDGVSLQDGEYAYSWMSDIAQGGLCRGGLGC